MMKMNRYLIVLIILIFLLVAVSGCAAVETPPDPVTLSFVVQSYEVDYFTAIAEEFMQVHPEITLEITPIQGNNFQAFSAGRCNWHRSFFSDSISAARVIS